MLSKRELVLLLAFVVAAVLITRGVFLLAEWAGYLTAGAAVAGLALLFLYEPAARAAPAETEPDTGDAR